MLEALGLDFITQMPVLNIDSASLLNTPYNPHAHTVVRGVDSFGRHFISFKLLDTNKLIPFVFTLVQSEKNASTWHPVPNNCLTGYFQRLENFIVKNPRLFKTLCNTLTTGSQDIQCTECIPDGTIYANQTYRVQLIQSIEITEELIQQAFPEYMIEAIGLEDMLKLPLFPIGDRSSDPGDAIDFITTRYTPYNLLMGWRHDGRPFICFELMKGGAARHEETLLTLFRNHDGSWGYCHNKAFGREVLKVTCNLGRFLTDPMVNKDEKVRVLTKVLNAKDHTIVRFSDGRFDYDEFRFSGIEYPIESKFTIEPSLHEHHQQLLRGEIEMNLEEDLINNNDELSLIKALQ